MPSHFDTQIKPHFDILTPRLQGQVIAHRGAPKVSPENTLSGFKMAANMKAQWVEFDTQCCGTDEWVILHDQTLERTTNGRGFVSDTPYEKLKHLDAGSWFDPKFKGEPILLLSELLEALQGLGLSPNIEIKFSSSHQGPIYPYGSPSRPSIAEQEMEKKKKEQSLIRFAEIVNKHWSSHLTPPLVSSFDAETLALLKKIAPDLARGLIVDDINDSNVDSLLEEMKRLECFSLHCDYENLQNKTLEYILSQNTRLLLYTINDPEIGKRYLDQGVTAIFSDYPNLLTLSSS